MFIWTFSGNWRRFLMVFPLWGLAILAKESMIEESRTEFTSLELVAAVICFLFLNFIQPKMRWRFKEPNWVLFSHGAGVNDGGIWVRLLSSLWTRLRVQMDIGSTKFLWIIASLGSSALILIGSWGWLSLFNDGSREVWDEIDLSSDGMMWGYWGFGSGVIVYGRPEGVAIVMELVYSGSM